MPVVRLDYVLDRSWEVEPVTWSQLTWWDPLPCGQLLLAHLHQAAPLLLPSPAASMQPNPPTPHRRLPPTHLTFGGGSSSSSPIPFTRRRTVTAASYSSTTTSNCSPLAIPLPLSPDSFSSVFLPDSPPLESPPGDGCSSGISVVSSVAIPFHESSNSPPNCRTTLALTTRSYTATSDSAAIILRFQRGGNVSLLPTPPNSEELNSKRRGGAGCGPGQRSMSHKMFNFPAPPPILSPGLLPIPPPLLSQPPPFLR
jgi:hypothetical protein